MQAIKQKEHYRIYERIGNTDTFKFIIAGYYHREHLTDYLGEGRILKVYNKETREFETVN